MWTAVWGKSNHSLRCAPRGAIVSFDDSRRTENGQEQTIRADSMWEQALEDGPSCIFWSPEVPAFSGGA